MAVEVAGQNPVEGVLREGKVERIADDELAMRNTLLGDLEHLLARVEPHDLAPQVLGHPARSTGDVQRAHRRKVGHRALEPLAFLVTAQPVPPREQTRSVHPVVVLGRASVVVRPHAPRVRAWRRSNPYRTSRPGATERRSTRSPRPSARTPSFLTCTPTPTTTARCS